MPRKPVALANWKMAMTVAESLAFVQEFQVLAGDCLDAVDVILCPPFTGLWPLARVLDEIHSQLDAQDRTAPSDVSRPPAQRTGASVTPHGSHITAPASRTLIQLGAQNMAEFTDPARTGQISGDLLADVGCDWVMLGHWEVRRHLGDDDRLVNRKVGLALEAGLRPIPFIGEAHNERAPLVEALEGHLARVLEGCTAEQIARMAFVYEPEGAIGDSAPTSPEHVASACTCIRNWLRRQWGEAAAERIRILYGGSVGPEFVPDLLACLDLDGLAATRRGRDPGAFADILQLIAGMRGGHPA